MRSLLLIQFILCAVSSLSAKLPPGSISPIYSHLAEVNERWMYEVGPQAYLGDTAFADETARIRYHLRGVHRVLSARSVGSLSAKQALARQASLAHLLTYADRGRFPINTAHPTRTPYFVDADGTHCAVGYLMHRTGADALVSEILSATNNGYVLQDLLQHAGVATWAQEHGFTAEELAWIQPGYPGNYLLNPQPFGRGLGIRGGQVLAAAQIPDRGSYLAGDFTDFDGVATNGFVRVEGTRVTPVIHDYRRITQLTAVPNSDLLVCVGVADTLTSTTSVRLFDVATETFLASYDFPDEPRVYIHTDSTLQPLLFVGAMREPTDTIAVFDLALDGRQLEPLATGYTLTGALYDSHVFGGAAILGGDFRVADATGSFIDSNQVRYDLARDMFLPDNNAIDPNSSVRPRRTNVPVFRFFGLERGRYRDLYSISGDYLTINPRRDSFVVQNFSAESGASSAWLEARYFRTAFAVGGRPGDIKAFSDEGLLLSGNIAAPGTPLDPENVTRLVATSMTRTFYFYTQEIPIEGSLSVMLRTGDSLLLAGDFTAIAGVPVQQLAYARPVVSDAPDVPALRVGAYVAAGQLHLDLVEALADEAQLFLYTSDGRLAQVTTLPSGQESYTVPLSVDSGALYFALQTTQGVGVGSVVAQGF